MIWRGDAVSVTLPPLAVATEPFGSWKIGWLNALNMSTRKSNDLLLPDAELLVQREIDQRNRGPSQRPRERVAQTEVRCNGNDIGHNRDWRRRRPWCQRTGPPCARSFGSAPSAIRSGQAFWRAPEIQDVDADVHREGLARRQGRDVGDLPAAQERPGESDRVLEERKLPDERRVEGVGAIVLHRDRSAGPFRYHRPPAWVSSQLPLKLRPMAFDQV